jgi:hypothetical protein
MIKSHVLYRLSYGLTCVTSMAYESSASSGLYQSLQEIPSRPARVGSNSMMGDDGKRGLRGMDRARTTIDGDHRGDERHA